MQRPNPGLMVLAAGALVLLVSLFLDWFDPGFSAWTIFETWDVVLAGLALLSLAVAAARLGWWRGPLPDVGPLLLAVGALVVVALALVNHPPAAVGRDLDGGAWLALVGAALMVAGALLVEHRVSLSVSVADAAPPTAAPRPTATAAADPDATVPLARQGRPQPR